MTAEAETKNSIYHNIERGREAALCLHNSMYEKERGELETIQSFDSSWHKKTHLSFLPRYKWDR